MEIRFSVACGEIIVWEERRTRYVVGNRGDARSEIRNRSGTRRLRGVTPQMKYSSVERLYCHVNVTPMEAIEPIISHLPSKIFSASVLDHREITHDYF